MVGALFAVVVSLGKVQESEKFCYPSSGHNMSLDKQKGPVLMVIFKRLHKTTALVFALALLLGLAVAGCSDNDDNSQPDTYSTKLSVVVEKAQEKGTVPSTTKELALVLFDSYGVPLGGFDEHGLPVSEKCTWKEVDNKLSTTMLISDKNVKDIAQLMVIALDSQGELLGTYSDTVKLEAGKDNPVDFSSNNISFVSEADMDSMIEYFALVEYGAVDSEGTVSVVVGKNYKVYLIDKYKNPQGVVFNVSRWGNEEYTLSDPEPLGAPITIDNAKKTIIGNGVVSGVTIDLCDADSEELLDTLTINVVAE